MSYSVYISHSVSPWELAQVYALAQETELQGLTSFVPDRNWDPSDSMPEDILQALYQSEVIAVFGTLVGSHSEWVNREIRESGQKPIIAIVERGIQLQGIEEGNIIRFDRYTDIAELFREAATLLSRFRTKNESNNLISGLLLGGLLFLVLRGAQRGRG